MAFYPHIQSPRPEVRAFLEDIREHPEDDAPRLILADWLDDNGDEIDRARGEFIRLQCYLARPEPTPPLLSRRLRQLLADYAEDWLGPLLPLVDGWRFERGMVHVAMQGIHGFAPELHELLHTETFAWVEGLTLRQMSGGLVAVAERLPLLDHIQVLTIEESRPSDTALGRLVCHHGLAGLRKLNLAGCHVTAWVVEALASEGHLPNLETLDLTRNYGGSQGLQALARSSVLPRLRRLHLGFNNVSDEALATLAESPLIERLEALDLRGNLSCTAMGLETLLDNPRAAALRQLNLSGVQVGSLSMQALARSPVARVLRELYLDRVNLGNEAIKQLAFSEAFPALELLSLARNHLTDEALIALAHGCVPLRPRVLDLSHNHIDREGAVVLATSPLFERLEELDLEDNRICDEGAFALASSPVLGRLHFLDVGSNGLTALGQAMLLRRFGHSRVLV